MVAPHVNLRDVLSADADGEWFRAKLHEAARFVEPQCGGVTGSHSELSNRGIWVSFGIAKHFTD